MDLYNKYLQYLKKNGNLRLTRKLIFDYPYTLLRQACDHRTLRERGIFFTGSKLAKALIKKIGTINLGWKVYDPTAGAGDLIVNYAEKLPTKESVESTVEWWGRIIYATELEASFVPLIKLRLLLLAYYRVCGAVKLQDINVRMVRHQFANIIAGDYADFRFDVDVVIVNPPFNSMVLKCRTEWGGGKVSNAAVILYSLEQLYGNAIIAAILPDVIRSGSRYARLRNCLPRYLIDGERSLGRFDKFTDVDVFFALGKRCDNRILPKTTTSRLPCIDDLFYVHVGNIVPHRDPKAGDLQYYLTARNVVTGEVMRDFKEQIKSLHKSVVGPFVTIKRTSSPSDKVRCAASLIASRNSFFVENHLIVLKAKQAMSLTRYRKIMHYLIGDECTCFLNRTIRCRHLTVEAVKQIPIKE